MVSASALITAFDNGDARLPGGLVTNCSRLTTSIYSRRFAKTICLSGSGYVQFHPCFSLRALNFGSPAGFRIMVGCRLPRPRSKETSRCLLWDRYRGSCVIRILHQRNPPGAWLSLTIAVAAILELAYGSKGDPFEFRSSDTQSTRFLMPRVLGFSCQY